MPKAVKVLLVDDAFNREGIHLYLKREGLQVVEAGDEATAWDLAQAQPLDAAVVDISIPPDSHVSSRVNNSFGIRLANRLKQAYPALGMVLFSAHEDRGAKILDMIREGTRGLATERSFMLSAKCLWIMAFFFSSVDFSNTMSNAWHCTIIIQVFARHETAARACQY